MVPKNPHTLEDYRVVDLALSFSAARALVSPIFRSGLDWGIVSKWPPQKNFHGTITSYKIVHP